MDTESFNTILGPLLPRIPNESIYLPVQKPKAILVNVIKHPRMIEFLDHIRTLKSKEHVQGHCLTLQQEMDVLIQAECLNIDIILHVFLKGLLWTCLLYTSPSPRDRQ